MEQNNSSLPKKNPLSMQIDLDKFAPATEEEKRQQDVMSKSTTFFRDGMRKLFKNPLAVGSLIVLSLIIITIIVAPMIVPYKYSEILSVNGRRDKGAKNMAPFTYSEMEQEYIAQGGQRFPHIFGTDEQCRDYFVRVIYGTRVSLCVGLFASIIVMIIGVIYGSISGYLGGKVDLIMMRIVDIIYSLPDMLMVILLAVVFDELIHFPNGSLLNHKKPSIPPFGNMRWREFLNRPIIELTQVAIYSRSLPLLAPSLRHIVIMLLIGHIYSFRGHPWRDCV